MAVVSLRDVHKFYPLGKERVEAVKGVSFDIEKANLQQFLVLLDLVNQLF